jgi:2'-hydroxyisoflavone reductase
MKRRDAIKLLAGTAAACSWLGESVLAQGGSSALKVLILGGTGFIGPHFVDALRARGHKLTLFNRGKRNPKLFPDLETLIGDRNGPVDALKGRDWDVVIDDSAYLAKHAQLTAEILKGHAGHYIFISSISAYADLAKPGIDEDAKLAQLADPNVDRVTEETYGGLKAACEKIVTDIFGEHSTIIRPTYIVGPGDPTDRFTYWPARVARGGEMLAPGSPSDPIQFIDVRDLADFARVCTEQRTAGTYNICNPPGAVTMGDLLDSAKRVSGSNARFVWANTEFLEKQKLFESGEIPIWVPPVGEFAGMGLVSSARAVAKGLRFRPVDTTVRDTLAWHAKRPKEQQEKLRAGLTPQRESELLKQLRAVK